MTPPGRDADDVISRLDEVADCVSEKMETVHNDVKLLDGRVQTLDGRVQTVESEARALKRLIEGHPERVMPDGGRDRGLAGDVMDQRRALKIIAADVEDHAGTLREHSQVVVTVNRGITAAKWMAGMFGAAAASLLANLAANLL